jgi:hypothetical protein
LGGADETTTFGRNLVARFSRPFARFERGDKNDLKVSELEHLQQIIIAMPDSRRLPCQQDYGDERLSVGEPGGFLFVSGAIVCKFLSCTRLT